MRRETTHGSRGECKAFTAALLISAIVTFGCSSTQITDQEPIRPTEPLSDEATGSEPLGEAVGGSARAEAPERPSYRIEVGDHFDVKIYGSPELKESLVVRPDGKVSLLLAEEIQAAGLTPAEFDSVLTEIYSRNLNNPQIAIIMRKFAGNRIYVGGEVNTPSEVVIEGRLTLLQAIYRAGGFRETAKLSSVVLLRDHGADMPEVLLVDVKNVLKSGQGDLLLYPYDAIFVPKTFIAKADKFVDQYINRIVPRNLTAGFSWSYDLNPWLEVFSN